MNLFAIIISVLLAIGVTAVLSNSCRARKRRRILANDNRVSTWSDVLTRPINVTRIVQIDFGFGKEVWVFSDNMEEIDLSLDAFKSGILVLPPPSVSDVERFCNARGIKLTCTVVKRGQ